MAEAVEELLNIGRLRRLESGFSDACEPRVLSASTEIQNPTGREISVRDGEAEDLGGIRDRRRLTE
jgi:hypothetical protein